MKGRSSGRSNVSSEESQESSDGSGGSSDGSPLELSDGWETYSGSSDDDEAGAVTGAAKLDWDKEFKASFSGSPSGGGGGGGGGSSASRSSVTTSQAHVVAPCSQDGKVRASCGCR